ncbi:MAG: acetyl-CoA carboxylase, carboxyltransferase subunit beta [Alphaproteobacteria bacterium]|jgi:acetyl-CoA carboxylase carboxyl transferase subunit beta|nr:acetyl-CoA carboxylase, carboxyltransferase subunit beta [Alphaproteobacteria bacterium]
MNWINKLINKSQEKSTNTQAKAKDIPDNLWLKCPNCLTLLFKKDLEKNNQVCTNCDYHFFLPVEKRLESLFDEGKYIKIDLPKGLEDPLKFKDKEKYIDKIKVYRQKTGYNDAFIAGYGKINGNFVVVGVMNFAFIGGSMGSAVGEGFLFAVEFAINKAAPFVVVSSSGGARMQEGMVSLMQMAKTTVAVEMLAEKKLPYIVVLTNPTTGGVTASFAMLGDIHIAESGATIGFAGARVIEQTIRKKLPDGFQTAEYLLEHGMVDLVVKRSELKATLGNVIDILVNKVKVA